MFQTNVGCKELGSLGSSRGPDFPCHIHNSQELKNQKAPSAKRHSKGNIMANVCYWSTFFD